MFTAPSLQHRWYAIAGNHDHYGNASAQVAYTKLSKRWFFPAFYYTETVSLSGGGSLQFVFIDTVLLCGQTYPTIRDLPPTGPASTAAAEDQWAWIEQTLSTSTADWLIVAGHYPGQCKAEDLHYSLPLPLDVHSLSSHSTALSQCSVVHWGAWPHLRTCEKTPPPPVQAPRLCLLLWP